MTGDSIYLDNAATSFPKPECVYAAVDDYNRNSGRAVGRGATDAGQALQQIVDRCRLRAAQLLGAKSRDQIVFTFNCTDSLNMILHGVLKPGDHVVTSMAEHNSVLRPLRQLERLQNVGLSIVDVDEFGFIDPAAVKASIRPETRLVVVQHASNVTGAIQPVGEIGEIARQSGTLFAVDAAQSAGHLPFSVEDLQADFVACSGHKGLLGPLGTGLLYIAAGREGELEPLRQGGTGSRSESDTQPDEMPQKFESGNHNAPGLVGLDAALGFLSEHGIEAVQQLERELSGLLYERLSGIAGLTIHSSPDRERSTGVISVSCDLYTSDELAALLNQHFHIDTRSGLHCAPGMHRRLGTLDRQGTVRISVGLHTTPSDVAAAADALQQICEAG